MHPRLTRTDEDSQFSIGNSVSFSMPDQTTCVAIGGTKMDAVPRETSRGRVSTFHRSCCKTAAIDKREEFQMYKKQ